MAGLRSSRAGRGVAAGWIVSSVDYYYYYYYGFGKMAQSHPVGACSPKLGPAARHPSRVSPSMRDRYFTSDASDWLPRNVCTWIGRLNLPLSISIPPTRPPSFSFPSTFLFSIPDLCPTALLIRLCLSLRFTKLQQLPHSFGQLLIRSFTTLPQIQQFKPNRPLWISRNSIGVKSLPPSPDHQTLVGNHPSTTFKITQNQSRVDRVC